jgi:hypothetical protein
MPAMKPDTSTHELFAKPITILTMPSWLGLSIQEEHELPLEPGDYKVTPGERWTVISLKTGETVYSGIGPVEVVYSSAPF